MNKLKIEIQVENKDLLVEYVEDFAKRYPETHYSLEKIKRDIEEYYASQLSSPRWDGRLDDFFCPVCTDWPDNCHWFRAINWFDRRTPNSLLIKLAYEGTFKG